MILSTITQRAVADFIGKRDAYGRSTILVLEGWFSKYSIDWLVDFDAFIIRHATRNTKVINSGYFHRRTFKELFGMAHQHRQID